jgi:hypothetical protein
VERRRAARRVPSEDEPISRARLRTGQDLAVVDVSNIGAQVEGLPRLLPGTHVEMHIVTCEGRVLVRSRIVRSFVCSLQADAIRYRAALTFEAVVDTAAAAGYEVPGTVRAATAAPGMAYPASTHRQGPQQSQPLASRGLRPSAKAGITFG